MSIRKSASEENETVPLVIHQTWMTKKLPANMEKAVKEIIKTNPEFDHYLYDDNDCELFIKEHFSDTVYYAFKSLIPGAYKADLWRYCVLYKYGGIYLDIKFVPVEGFKFINLVNQEYFTMDRPQFFLNRLGIYNAFIIAKPNNVLLMDAINSIVDNVARQKHGYNSLYPTGPGLLGDLVCKKKISLITPLKFNNDSIYYNNHKILKTYSLYREELAKSDNKHYSKCWQEKKIYDTESPDYLCLVGLYFS